MIPVQPWQAKLHGNSWPTTNIQFQIYSWAKNKILKKSCNKLQTIFLHLFTFFFLISLSDKSSSENCKHQMYPSKGWNFQLDYVKINGLINKKQPPKTPSQVPKLRNENYHTTISQDPTAPRYLEVQSYVNRSYKKEVYSLIISSDIYHGMTEVQEYKPPLILISL